MPYTGGRGNAALRVFPLRRRLFAGGIRFGTLLTGLFDSSFGGAFSGLIACSFSGFIACFGTLGKISTVRPLAQAPETLLFLLFLTSDFFLPFFAFISPGFFRHTNLPYINSDWYDARPAPETEKNPDFW